MQTLGTEVPVATRICRTCGEPLKPRVRFCRRCGASTAKDAPVPATITWTFDVPMLTNRFVLSGLAKALGIPFAVLAVIIGVAMRDSPDWSGFGYAAIFIGIWLALTVLAIFVIYGNRYPSQFVVDGRGALMAPTRRLYRKNTALNTTLVVAGALAGRLAAVGTGLIAQQSQGAGITWRDARRAVRYPKQRAVALRNSWRNVLILYCTDENYDQVADLVDYYVERTNARREGGRRT